MAVLEALTDEEKMLVALLLDASGIDIAEFLWKDPDAKNKAGKKDQLFRCWSYQYPWSRNDSKKQIDQCGRAIGKSVGIQMRAYAFPFCNPGQDMLITAPEMIHLDPVTKVIEDRLMATRLSREMLKSGNQSSGITHRPFEAKFRNNAKIVGRIPQKDGKGVKGMHPRMLETMDKLRFDCFRVGMVKENIDEMEPVLRNSHMFSFDISAIAHAFAPSNTSSPNGLSGEEACILMQYAGMSNQMRSIGIYGYQPERDRDALTAKQISHMLWYLMDGRSRGNREASLEDRDLFNEFHTAFAEVDTVFLQSKKTGRWWMQLPDKEFIPCSYKDYLLASSNEIPERWLRAQERPS